MITRSQYILSFVLITMITSTLAIAQPVPPNQQAMDALKRGDVAFAKNDLTTAITEYTSASAADPKLESAYMHCGDAQTVAHHFPEALAQYQKAIDLQTNDPRAFIQHAHVAYQLNDVDTAMLDCNQAIAIDMRNFDAYMFRGNCYLFKNDFDTAIADYGEAIALKPKNANAWYAQGYAFACQMKQPDWVIFDMTQVINLSPKFTFAYVNRGVSYIKKQMFKEALADEQQAIALDPKEPWPHVDAGEAYEGLNDYDHALAEFNKALELNPNFAPAYNDRGVYYEHMNNMSQAIEEYQQSLKCDPEYQLAQSNLNAALSKTGQVKPISKPITVRK